MHELWKVACSDAGFQDGREVVLQEIAGQPPGGAQQSWAVWEAPGISVQPDANYPLAPAQLAALNAPGTREKFRIIAFTDTEPEMLLGYFRHELEHARQFEANEADFVYSPIVMLAITEQLGNLNGTGSIYNLMPRELDANAAAAALIRAHFGPQPSARYRGLHAAMFRPTEPPEEPSSLFFRTFCFSFLFEDGLAVAFQRVGISQEEFFRAQNPIFVEAWEKLRADTKLGRLVDRAYKSVPSRKAIQAAGKRPGDAWSDAVRHFKSANKRALTVLEWP